MDAAKIQVKVFATESVPVEDYVPVFHRLIREKAFGELLIDVVDYSHVEGGPHVLLVGHGSDYALDFDQERLGLLYNRKREAPPPAERLRDALRRAFAACALIEQAPEPKHKVRFRGNELLFRINDRIAASNDDATFERIAPELRGELERLYEGSRVELRRVGGARELFAIEAKAEKALPIADLLARLGGPF